MNILKMFAIPNFRSKVKVIVDILGKKLCHGSSAFLWTDFALTSHKYDNIWDKCAFQNSVPRSKSQMTFYEKKQKTLSWF